MDYRISPVAGVLLSLQTHLKVSFVVGRCPTFKVAEVVICQNMDALCHEYI